MSQDKPTQPNRSTFLIKPGGTQMLLHKTAQSEKHRTTSGREALFPSFIWCFGVPLEPQLSLCMDFIAVRLHSGESIHRHILMKKITLWVFRKPQPVPWRAAPVGESLLVCMPWTGKRSSWARAGCKVSVNDELREMPHSNYYWNTTKPNFDINLWLWDS